MGTNRRPRYRWNGLDETIVELVLTPEELVIETFAFSWAPRRRTHQHFDAAPKHAALLASSSRPKLLAQIGPIEQLSRLSI